MDFIKCKNETEKLAAIKRYCEAQVAENDRRIKWFEAERESSLDYYEEIHECKTRKAHFGKIVEIIEADEHTSIMII